VEEQDLGDNPYFLDQGVPLCPEELPVYTTLAPIYDDYDPSDIPDDQAAPTEEGYNYPVPENPLPLPTPDPLPDCVSETDPNASKFTAQGVPLCPEELPTYTTESTFSQYDDYDPNDIPEDQAAPTEEEGYNYPVPENPLTLPPKPTITMTTTSIPLPDCVPEEEQTLGNNPEFLDAGVPICPKEEESLPVYTPQTTTAPVVVDYDDYDPNDIPEDQAKPTEEPKKGYNYPIPDNPLVLPSRSRKPKLIVVDDDKETIGLTHLDTDSYDPGNYDHNSPDYIEEIKDIQEEKGRSSRLNTNKFKEEFGAERHGDPFNLLLGGSLIPPGLSKNKNVVKTKENVVTTHKTKQNTMEKKQNDTTTKFRNRKHKGRKNKKNSRKNNSKSSNRKNKTNNHSSTTSTSSTRKPRTGKSSSSRSGRRNISVRDWLARG